MDKEKLEFYLEQGYSLSQLAIELDSSPTNIRYWLKKFALKTKRGPKGKKPKEFSFARKCSCGETDSNKFYGNKTQICGKCHSAYTLKRGQEQRRFILEYLGGQCKHCGYNKYPCSLDAHHIDPSQKDPGFRTSRGWAKEKLIKELEKCILLCKNCHTAFHNGFIILNE